jgi:type I restriction enzyme, S subunit
MAGEWREATFQQLIDEGMLEIGDGYRAQNNELGGTGPIFLRAGHVTDTHIDFAGVEHFHEHRADKVRSKMSKVGDTIVTTKGNSTGRTSFVTDRLPPFVYSPHLSYWRSRDPEKLSGGFLRYWSQGVEFIQQLSGMKASTDMAPYLSLTDQRRLGITLPPLAKQKAIAAMLGTLDEKIELNRRMNASLEATSRALFQSWFVDFDPVRTKLDGRQPVGLDPDTAALFPDSFQDSSIGHIPAGWEVAELGQTAEVIDCLHAKKPERCENGQLYLQLNNIRDDGLIDITDSFFVSLEDYRKWTSRIEARAGDCVITNVGRVGAVGQIPEGVKAALGRNITGIRCKSSFPFPTFLIECLVSESMREEIRLKTDSGTILDALNVKSIPKLRFVRPTREVGTRFESLTRPLRRRMEQNLSESRVLATLRDTLLQKLLSGEITIPTP